MFDNMKIIDLCNVWCIIDTGGGVHEKVKYYPARGNCPRDKIYP